MTDSIDLTKFNIMTDSMYDTTGTQMNEVKRTMVYTTPFEQQPKYNMRAGNKPFQASKYPSAGYEWYAKRAVNDVDLQTDMEKVLPDQQVQNWSRVKTVILQKEDSKPKETAIPSQLTKSGNPEIQQALQRIRKRQAEKKKKEGYITSPFGDFEDTWSSAGRIKDQIEEKFTVAGKEFEVIDIIIVILAIVIIVVAVYMFMTKKKDNKQATISNIPPPPPLPAQMNDSIPPPPPPRREPVIEKQSPKAAPNSVQPPAADNSKTSGGGKVLNCGMLCGGAAFDTKI
jgi:hypothetical protein